MNKATVIIAGLCFILGVGISLAWGYFRHISSDNVQTEAAPVAEQPKVQDEPAKEAVEAPVIPQPEETGVETDLPKKDQPAEEVPRKRPDDSRIPLPF